MTNNERIITGLAFVGALFVTGVVVYTLNYSAIDKYFQEKKLERCKAYREAGKKVIDPNANFVDASTFIDHTVNFTYAERLRQNDYSIIAGIFDTKTQQIKNSKKFQSREIDATLKKYHANGNKVVIYN